MVTFTILTCYYHFSLPPDLCLVTGTEEIEEKFVTILIGRFGEMGGFGAACEAEKRR